MSGRVSPDVLIYYHPLDIYRSTHTPTHTHPYMLVSFSWIRCFNPSCLSGIRIHLTPAVSDACTGGGGGGGGSGVALLMLGITRDYAIYQNLPGLLSGLCLGC